MMYAGHCQDQLSVAARELQRVVLEEKPAGRRELAGGLLRARTQSDKISHIDMGDDHIDTVISHIISPYPISISRMTISIW